jgi:hypothetical protein
MAFKRDFTFGSSKQVTTQKDFLYDTISWIKKSMGAVLTPGCLVGKI